MNDFITKQFVVPNVVISRCIEIDPCRYNALKISSEFVKKLLSHVNVIPVCPEVEIGLGTPRDPLRIIEKNGRLRLIQPKTGLDVTKKMESFTNSFLNSLTNIDGFILKSRSPSSALFDAKRYSGPKPGAALLGKGSGFFGQGVLEKFSHLAIEDEGRLRNPAIKANFLTKLYSLAEFRKIKKAKSQEEILKFHTKNKLLLKAFNEKQMRILGKIVAKRSQYAVDELLEEYETHFYGALKNPPTCGAQINVLMNSMGYFSKKLSGDEKKFFLKSLDDYKAGNIPFSLLIGIFKSWLIRFKEDYLFSQSFFEPYPNDLADIDLMTNYCDGKDYW
jgi:uncharacterized protein YbgA (DUF1722 family)/uncharacterized protein YbbK (DUF523 family)